MQPQGQPRLLQRLSVGPDPADPRHLALAERHRQADRIAVLADRRARPPFRRLPARDRLEEPARPDDLPGHPAASEHPRQRRALARAHDPEPLDRPVSTGADPSPSSRWSIAEPRIAPPPCRAPAASPAIEPPRAPPSAAPAADRTASPSLASVGKAKDAGDPPRPGRRQRRFDHAMPGIGMDSVACPPPTAPGCRHAWRRRLPHAEHQHVAGARRAAATGSRCRPAAAEQLLRRGSAPTSRGCRPAPSPAPARAARARRRAAARGNRCPRRGSSPGAGMACRSSARARATIASPRRPQLLQARAVMDRPVLRIGRHPVVARDMRKAAEIEEVVELRPAGLRALVASRDDPEAIARRGPARPAACQRRARAPPGRRRSALTCRPAGVRAARARSATPCVNQPSSNPSRPAARRIRPPAAVDHLALAGEARPLGIERRTWRRRAPGRRCAGRRPTGAFSASASPRSSTSNAPSAARISPKLPRNSSTRSSGRSQSTSQCRTSARRNRPARTSSSLTAASLSAPDRLGVVDAEPGRRLQRARVHAAARPKDGAVEDDVLVMVGEAERHAVAPAHPPAAAELRRPAVEPRLQLRIDRAHQTRTSTTGIDGISPAANPARLALIRSVSNRTGTSNSKPAVTSAPAAGAAARCTCPVA